MRTDVTASLRRAADDVIASAARKGLWGALGWNDLKRRYSGSLLGALWITVNILLLVGCLTLVFATPLGGDASRYAPYVAIGLVLWQPISACLNEAATVFVASADTLRNTTLPLSLQIFRLVWRHLLAMALASFVIPLVLLAFQVVPSPLAWTLLPALALLSVMLFSVSLLLGIAGARFRDLAPIVANVMQLLFFLTPIFWIPTMLGPKFALMAAINPLAAFIDIIRAPLLGEAPLTWSWPVAGSATLVAIVSSAYVLGRTRHRVPYWV